MAEDSGRFQLNQVLDNINSIIEEVVDTKQMNALGEYAIQLIAKRTRLGYGVNSAGEKRQRLPALKPITVAIRTAAKKQGRLDERTSPKKSNLTFTGQLIDSLGIAVSAPGQIIIQPQGYRSDDGEIKANLQLARVLAKRGFRFLNISDAEFRQLGNFLRDGLTSALTRRLKK